MSWDQFWHYFTEQPAKIKKDLLLQLDLVEMMRILPIEERRIVLKCAPKAVIDRLAELVRNYNDKDQRVIESNFRRLSRKT